MVRINVNKFVFCFNIDDVNVNLEIFFKFWNECISEWFVVNYVYYFIDLFS